MARWEGEKGERCCCPPFMITTHFSLLHLFFFRFFPLSKSIFFNGFGFEENRDQIVTRRGVARKRSLFHRNLRMDE